jgi:hypothetical protein
MLVISIRTATAMLKYVLSARVVSCQYLYNQLAVSSLPTSSVPAITAIGIAAALKIAISPAILNHAATPAIARAVINVRIPNNIYIFTYIFFTET